MWETMNKMNITPTLYISKNNMKVFIQQKQEANKYKSQRFRGMQSVSYRKIISANT